MSLPPNRLGDKGQRYEIHCSGYPEDGDNVIGWHNDVDAALRMAAGIELAPSAVGSHVLDRENQHEWFHFRSDLIGCRKCGRLKRRDGENNPCPGIVKIGLRDHPTKDAPLMTDSTDHHPGGKPYEGE